MRLPGVGPLISTAIIAAVGDSREFHQGREMAAWLGLTPKHRASGYKKRMQGISKRGDSYIRTLLIQGSRSVLLRSTSKSDRRSLWITDKISRLGGNKATVALANKMAREIWAVLTKKEQFVLT